MESNVNVEEAIDHAQRSNGSQKYVKWQFSLEFDWKKSVVTSHVEGTEALHCYHP